MTDQQDLRARLLSAASDVDKYIVPSSLCNLLREAAALSLRPTDDELWDQTIRERDDAEDALGRMFQAVTGRPAEWSSAWHYGDAIDEVEDHIAALSAPKQAGEPARYFADGPQGHFFADDLQLARNLVNLYDKQDDWTITDLQSPTGLSSPQAAPVHVEGEVSEDYKQGWMSGMSDASQLIYGEGNKAVRWEMRRSNSITGEWLPWFDCSEQTYDEIINGEWNGFASKIDARALYPEPPSQPAVELGQPEKLVVEMFYQAGDRPFICSVRGACTTHDLGKIENEVCENPPHEFDTHGDGTYKFSAHYFAGQYGENGRCEFAPGFELNFIGHEGLQEPNPDSLIDGAKAGES